MSRIYREFSEKKVIMLQCKYCDNCLSARGMKANLLADTTVELFSTDSPKLGNIAPVGKAYKAETCNCYISDIACHVCGNIVGYHVTRPCVTCLSSCNNGHFWMFFSEASYHVQRFNNNVDQSGRHCQVCRPKFALQIGITDRKIRFLAHATKAGSSIITWSNIQHADEDNELPDESFNEEYLR